MAVKRKLLTTYDYEIGGPWAGPEERIKREHPNREVFDDDPARMTEEIRGHTGETSPFDIDAPTGRLAASGEDQR